MKICYQRMCSSRFWELKNLLHYVNVQLKTTLHWTDICSIIDQCIALYKFFILPFVPPAMKIAEEPSTNYWQVWLQGTFGNAPCYRGLGNKKALKFLFAGVAAKKCPLAFLECPENLTMLILAIVHVWICLAWARFELQKIRAGQAWAYQICYLLANRHVMASKPKTVLSPPLV